MKFFRKGYLIDTLSFEENIKVNFNFFTSIAEAHYNEVFLGLKRKLPPNIHLLSLELYDENHVLVRLEHCKFFFELTIANYS